MPRLTNGAGAVKCVWVMLKGFSQLNRKPLRSIETQRGNHSGAAGIVAEVEVLFFALAGDPVWKPRAQPAPELTPFLQRQNFGDFEALL